MRSVRLSRTPPIHGSVGHFSLTYLTLDMVSHSPNSPSGLVRCLNRAHLTPGYGLLDSAELLKLGFWPGLILPWIWTDTTELFQSMDWLGVWPNLTKPWTWSVGHRRTPPPHVLVRHLAWPGLTRVWSVRHDITPPVHGLICYLYAVYLICDLHIMYNDKDLHT